MKKMLFILAVLVALGFAADCSSNLDITMDLVAHTSLDPAATNDISPHQPPATTYYSEHDRLAVRSFVIYNTGDLAVEPAKIEIAVTKPTEKFTISCEIPDKVVMNPNRTYAIENLRCNDLILDEPGRYIFDLASFQAANTTCSNPDLPHSVTQTLHLNYNTSTTKVLFVKPLSDVKALDDNKLMLAIIVAVAAIAIIFGLITVYYARKTSEISRNAKEEHLQALKEITGGIHTSSKAHVDNFSTLVKRMENAISQVAKHKKEKPEM